MTMDSWSDDDSDNLAFDDVTPPDEDDTLDLGLEFDDDHLDDDADVDLDDDPDVTDDSDHEPIDVDEPTAPDGVDGDDEYPGSDPDIDPRADDAAFEPQFPPELDIDPRPEPVDGPPWSDAGLLGTTTDPAIDHVWNASYDSVDPSDLHALDGGAGSDWDALLTSDDPAVSSLARWWQP
ncbi:hypothetical protein [Stackebrandtia soli]|uniref:hypothetical protein n=1 Tax=Stackebrandtia soli TaxID=1892856 RepID=UPI0039E7FF95